MSLTNQQYDQLMRQYETLRSDRESLIHSRRKEIYAKIPRFQEIDNEIATSSVDLIQASIEGGLTGSVDTSNLHSKIEAMIQEKIDLLKAHGFDENYLNPPYHCPDCKDTGYIDHRPCHCFTQRAIDLLYSQDHVQKMFEVENFRNFSFDYYADDFFDSTDGAPLSARENSEKAYRDALAFVHNFSSHHENMLIYGDTGVGKTFLSNCIGKAILDQGFSVIYLSAFQLFEIFEKNTFRKKDSASDDAVPYKNIFDCDLLIIDDLGTEFSNSFTVSQLFQCINERLLHKRSTVISTNLKLRDIREVYSERISSRFIENYTLIHLFGEDIRVQKQVKEF
ncbi:MAG: ATP-binding protein [Lachnospiraceae bacterium]|nr:ATP-binding protein [Lachnospiraceae bacterium]